MRLLRVGSRHVVQVVDEVGDARLVLDRRHRARRVGSADGAHDALAAGRGLDAREALDRRSRRRAPSRGPRTRSRHELARALQLHSTCGMPTFGNTRLFQPVARLLVAIERRAGSCRASRRRARAPRPTGRAAPRRTTPWRRPASSRPSSCRRSCASLNIRLSLDLRSVRPRSCQPLVAHVLRAVAVEAVVDEVARAALQRLVVEPVDRRGDPCARRRVAGRRTAARRPARAAHGEEMGDRVRHSHRHPFRHRLGLVARRVPRHQEEERGSRRP